MKIAVFASGQGEKALYLYEFFKEGNRVEIDCLLTDNPSAPIARRLKSDGIEVIEVLPEQLTEEMASRLRDREVEMIVVDDYNGEIPSALKEEYKDAVIYPTVRERAPLEVISAVDKLKNAPAPAAAPVPPAYDDEWADALNIQPPKYEEPAPEPPKYEKEPEIKNPDEVFIPQSGFRNRAPQQEPQRPYYNPGGQPEPPVEPMPKTYLLWSVIITILCCFIPGIIAIYYSATVSSKYYSGNIEGAKRASRNAQIWCIISIVAGIVWATLYLPLMIFIG